MHEHDRKYVAKFFSDISSWSDAYTSIAVSYIAFRDKDRFALTKARIFLEGWAREIERTQICFDSLQAGVFYLSDLGVTPEDYIKSLEQGIFLTPDENLSFLPDDNGAYSAYYDPYVSEGAEANYRLSLLSISGGRANSQPRNAELDWELKSGEKPFDNVNALLMELGLGAVKSDRAMVEFVAFNCLKPHFAEPYGAVLGKKAYPAFLLVDGLDKTKASLGYQVYHNGKVVLRERIDGCDLEWGAIDGGMQGSKEITIPEGAVLQCFGSYDRSTQFQWWMSDPSTVQNPLRTVYNTFDEGLEVLNDYLSKGPGKGNARDLETAVAWLLWMLGFHVAHLGATPRNQEAPDLVATTSLKHFLVIECTTDLLKADNKLPKLIGRTEALRVSLDASGNRHLRTLPVIVSSKTRKEVLADIEQAEKLGVLVITRDEILKLLERTLILSNAEDIYNEAELEVKKAIDRHSPKGIL